MAVKTQSPCRVRCRNIELSGTFIELLNFFVQSVATQRRIVLLLLKALRMRLEILSGRIARRRLTLFTGFGALKSNDSNFAFFLCHGGLRNRSV